VAPTEQRPPKTIDSADRAHILKVLVLFGGPCFIILGALWFFFAMTGVISRNLAGVLVLLDIPIAVAAALGIHAAVRRGSAGLMNTIYSWGGSTPMPQTYPRQEALIARGAYAEAAEYFRDHIRVTPEDLEARLRLAALAERYLREDTEAEQLYLEVRKRATSRDQQFAASNGLIDLYRRMGRKDRLRVELARFAERYPGTAAANAAAAELRELKKESV
jgi:tetratricopeptide (TPR) repeat protein